MVVFLPTGLYLLLQSRFYLSLTSPAIAFHVIELNHISTFSAVQVDEK